MSVSNPVYDDQYDEEEVALGGEDAHTGDNFATDTSAMSSSTTQKSSYKPLAFVRELKNATKEDGDNLKLRCDVTGTIPATSILWYKNDAPIIEERNRVKVNL